MKIRKLHLKAFGCFTDQTLDFSSPKSGLQIIFGPNEAGKSTTMRALDSFFFGFGHTTPDAFLHSYKDLAVGAELETETGPTLDLTRFKRAKNDLVNQAGQAIDPAVLNGLMTGLTRDMYTNMFSLGHQSLRLGAKEILEGGGHLGETLFAAASGITSLRLTLEDLRKGADELFTPRAYSKPVWQNIQEISRLGRELQQIALKPEQWKTLRQGLEKAVQNKDEIEGKIRSLESEISRKSRFHQAIPLISGYLELKSQLKALGQVPVLSPDFPEKREKILAGLNRLKSELSSLSQLESKLVHALKDIPVSGKALDFAPEIDRLHLKASAVAQARENILALEQDIREIQGSIKQKTEMLPSHLTPADLDQIQLNTLQTRKLESLARELNSLQSSITQAQRDLWETQKDLTTTQDRLAKFEKVPDRKNLEILSRRLAQSPELMEQESTAARKVSELSSKINKQIQSLGLWKGSRKELSSLVLPLQETIDLFDRKIQESRHGVDLIQKEIQDLQNLISSRKRELNGIDPDRSLPSPDDLIKARALRDHGWSLVKTAWLDHQEDQSQISTFLVQTSSDSLALGFEKSLSQVDAAADDLLANAERVAASSGLVREIAKLELKTEELEAELESRTGQHTAILQKWAHLWPGLDSSPLSPREMSAWTARVNEIRRLEDDLDQESQDLDLIRKKTAQLKAAARDILTREGFSLPGDADLITLYSLTDQALNKASELLKARTSLEFEQEKTASVLEKIQLKINDLNQDLQSTKSEWTRALAETGLSPEQRPEDTLEEIRIIKDILSSRAQAEKLAGQKNSLEKKCREFTSQVINLMSSLDYTRTGQDRPEDIIARLHGRLRDEQKKADQKDRIEQRLAETREKIDLNRTELEILEKDLAYLCREADAAEPDLLPDIIEQFRRKNQLQTKFEHLQDKLQSIAAGENLDQFVATAGQSDPDQLQAEISSLKNQKLELNTERDAIIEEKREFQLKLKHMDGTSRALEVEQAIQDQKASLEENVQQYIRFRLAADILAAEVERYRAANQGPVLRTAGDIFQTITSGAFKTIITDFNEKGEPVIMAARGQGEKLGVNDLSDGSRDQLFLALRLGGIYRYLENNPPFPFMVDDILVHFDDQRSLNTLAVLAELSRKTQVLFFTHHRHLVDLALQIPEKDAVIIHELSAC